MSNWLWAAAAILWAIGLSLSFTDAVGALIVWAIAVPISVMARRKGRDELTRQIAALIRESRPERVEDSSSSGVSRASQLVTLSRLHDEGNLTDEEFRAAKVSL